MLKLGASKHWKDALNELTGERTLNSNALLHIEAVFRRVLQTVRLFSAIHRHANQMR